MMFSATLLMLAVLELRLVSSAPVYTGPKRISMPLTRQEPRDVVHGELLYERHVNNAHRKLARMNGLSAGSEKRSCHETNATVSSDAAVLETPSDNSKGFTDDEVDAIGATIEAEDPEDENSLGLDIFGADVAYTAVFEIGNPPREFRLLIDSGSADTWVGSDQCQSELGGPCGNHTFLSAELSDTLVELENTWQIKYGAGEVSGRMISDNFAFGPFELQGHVFGVADVETDHFANNGTLFDGVFGTAHSNLSRQDTPTVVEALKAQGLIAEAIVSYRLPRVADGYNNGSVTFGEMDEDMFDTETMVTLPNLSTRGFWEGAMDEVSVNGVTLGFTGRTAIFDTGTSLLAIPPKDAQLLHAAIPGAKYDGNGGYTVPCTTNTTVSLSFGGRFFDIDTRDLPYFPVTRNVTGECHSGISPVEGYYQWLIGDTFLKSVFLSTNVDRNTIVLAEPSR